MKKFLLFYFAYSWGKYLYDFNILKHKSGYFVDCEKKNIDNLFKH